MPRALLFGYEGGLVDPAGRRFEALAETLAEEGIDLSDELLEACPFGPPYEEWLGAVIERTRARAEPALAARLMARAAASYRSLSRERGPAWRDGAVALVERAADRGLALGIVTGLPTSEVAHALAGAGLERRFKVVVGTGEGEEAESRLAAYRQALGRLNTEPPLPERLIHPHEVTSIEGSVAGVQAAAAAGLVTVAIGGGRRSGAGADYVVESLVELDLEQLDSG